MLDLLKELKEFNQSSMASNGFGRALMISHDGDKSILSLAGHHTWVGHGVELDSSVWRKSSSFSKFAQSSFRHKKNALKIGKMVWFIIPPIGIIPA